MTSQKLPKVGSEGEETFALQCRAYGFTPEREFSFHPKRRWRFDFAFPDLRVAVEVEGAAWSQGRHTRGSGFKADCEKYNSAALMGWTVLRFTTEMVISGQAINTILPVLGKTA